MGGRVKGSRGLSGGRYLVVGAVVALAAGCASSGSRVATPEPLGGWSPAAIANYVTAANDAEIQIAQLAVQRSTDAEVRHLAEAIAAEHQKANRDLAIYLGREAPRFAVASERDGMSAQSAPPEEAAPAPLAGSPASAAASAAVVNALELQNARRASALWSVAEPTFDRAYVLEQIARHELLLKTLDGALIPAAQDPALRQLLESLSTEVQAQVDVARRVRDSRGF